MTARISAIPRFAGPGSRVKILDRLEQARHSVRLARAAGVAIVGGTDFGGGSARANQLPWEVECLVDAVAAQGAGVAVPRWSRTMATACCWVSREPAANA